MTWTFIWLMVVLKIPALAALWVIWWAIKQDPDKLEEVDDDGGIKPSPQPAPSGPRLPRRGGPHNYPLPLSPARVRHGLAQIPTHAHTPEQR